MSRRPDEGRNRGRGRRAASLALAAAVAGIWIAATVVARVDTVAAIVATHVLFVTGLVATYAAAWALAALWTRARPRLVVFRAVLTTLVLVVLLGIVETPAWLGLIDYGQYWEKATGAWRGPARSFVPDPDLGFRRPPNLEMEGRPRGDIAAAWNVSLRAPDEMTFTYNAKGFRSLSDYSSADLVSLGDSHVEGWYVTDGETVTDHIGRLTGLATANLGQVGFGPGQEARLLEMEGLALSPETVVWFFYEGNDLHDDWTFAGTLAHYEKHGRDAAPPSRGVPFRQRSFTINAVFALRRVLHPLIPNGMPFTGRFTDAAGTTHRMYFHGECMYELTEFEERLFERNKQAFLRGKALCDANGIDLLLCYVPTKYRVYRGLVDLPEHSPVRAWEPWDLPDRFAAFCEQEGLDCLDLTPPMREAASRGVLLHDPGESHWNAAAHELVARFVAERLARGPGGGEDR